MADLTYTNDPGQMATPPNNTPIRATESTEAGHVGNLLQHVKLDTGDGTNTQPVAPVAADLVSGSRVSTDGIGDIINQDVTNYRFVSVQLTGTWAGTVTFAVTNDGTNWVNCPVQDLTAPTTAGGATKTANGLYFAMLPPCKTMRVRWTTVTSGTVVAAAYFSTIPPAVTNVGGVFSIQTGTTTATSVCKAVDSAVGGTDTGVAALVQRVTTPAAITPAANDYTRLIVDDNGRLWVNPIQPLTASAPAAATVGTSTGQAVAANANRRGLVLVNTSSNAISIGIGNNAVLNSGITLNASGGTFVMDQYTLSTAAINAIAAGISSNLAIQEYT